MGGVERVMKGKKNGRSKDEGVSGEKAGKWNEGKKMGDTTKRTMHPPPPPSRQSSSGSDTEMKSAITMQLMICVILEEEYCYRVRILTFREYTRHNY